MAEHLKKKKKSAAPLIAAIVVVLILASAALAARLLFAFPGGAPVSRSATEIDLNGAGIKSTGELMKLRAPKKMDLRGNEISAEDFAALSAAFPDCEILWDVPLGGVGEVYDCLSESVSVPVFHPDKAKLYALMPNLREIDLRDAMLTVEDFKVLQSAVPNCRIIWNIPIAGQSFDSTAESITLSDFSVSDAENFAFFENLKLLDTADGTSYAAYLVVETLLPDCEVKWSVALGNMRCDPEAEKLELAGSGVTVSELINRIGLFANIERVELGEVDFSDTELEQLCACFPGLPINYNVELWGRTFFSLDEKLFLRGDDMGHRELIDAARHFVEVEEIDLRETAYTAEELIAVAEAYPGAFILADVELYGKQFCTDVEEIDLSGIEISDTAEIENALVLFPNLKKVIMCDCGIYDEDMDALNRRHESVQFVWTVRFSVYAVRSDATAFCASNVPGYVAPKLTDEQLAPIKYLTELEALDLGHMYYSDLSFLENMPKLRYLILVEANYRDISAIASLSELYYLELFNNRIEDISPLLECKNLRHLNLGFTRGYDASCLAEMTWLERLWYPGGVLSADEISTLETALGDTQTYFAVWDGDGSTGGGWREHESYYEMRDLFDMHYMPGGTGVPGNEE